MGVYVSLNILPDQIDDAQWEAVFDEAVILAKSYPKRLMKFTSQEVHSATRYVLSSQIVDEEEGTLSICGDFETRKRAEQFVIPKKKPRTRPQQELFEDVILAYPDNCSTIFHEKTQGEPYHIAVIALGALYESRFPKAALVSGDIDFEQCKAAVEWANKVLDIPISMPVSVEGQRLIARLKPYVDSDSLEARFRDLFRGSETNRRMFLIEYQGKQNALTSLAKELGSYESITVGALCDFRSWLDATHDIEGLFQASCIHEQGPQWEVSEVVSSLSRLWVLNSVDETEELMEFVQQGGLFTLQIPVLAAFYPELNPSFSERWYRPGVPPVIEAITAVTDIPKDKVKKMVMEAYLKQVDLIKEMKQKAVEEIKQAQEESQESFKVDDKIKETLLSKIDEFKQFLSESEVPLTVDTLLPVICRMAEHNQIVLTEDAWAKIDDEKDVEVLLAVAYLFSLTERTQAVVKGREEIIESGEYRNWFVSTDGKDQDD